MPSSSAQQQPRPLFVYGTLCAMPLLAWILTGDSRKTDSVSKLARKAIVKGYARYTVRDMDYPAVIKDESSSVDGLLLFLQNRSQRTKLDDFEGEMYQVTAVLATILVDSDGSNDGGEERVDVDADMYVWNADGNAVSSEPWDLDTFIQERLDDWLGFELVGDDDSEE